MLRILERKQETDRNRLVAPRFDGFDQKVEFTHVERYLDLSLRVDSLSNGESVGDRYERLRLPPADGKDLTSVVALNCVDVAIVLGRQKRHFRASARQHRIKPHRSAVDKEIDRGVLKRPAAEAR